MMLGKLLVADRVNATNYMMEKMRQDAIEQLLHEWRGMLIDYHATGWDASGGKMDKTCRELLELGVDIEYLSDVEQEIMDKVYGDDC